MSIKYPTTSRLSKSTKDVSMRMPSNAISATETPTGLSIVGPSAPLKSSFIGTASKLVVQPSVHEGSSVFVVTDGGTYSELGKLIIL